MIDNTKIKWYIECYHYETRVVHETDKDGKSQTRHERHRVVTYRKKNVKNTWHHAAVAPCEGVRK